MRPPSLPLAFFLLLLRRLHSSSSSLFLLVSLDGPFFFFLFHRRRRRRLVALDRRFFGVRKGGGGGDTPFASGIFGAEAANKEEGVAFACGRKYINTLLKLMQYSTNALTYVLENPPL